MKPACKFVSFFLEITHITRFLISLFITGGTFFLIEREVPVLFRLMIAWIIFSCVFLILSWMVIFLRQVDQIKKKAVEDDGSTIFVFFMVIISSFTNIFIVLLLMMSKDQTFMENPFFVPLNVAGILLSWAMMHTIYVFHYAHEYYNGTGIKGERFTGGLDFPSEKNPDYMDFAYFSFVMGSTFQVSDVSIVSKRIRRIALVHGVLSFLFNTFVVALTINIIAGLMK